MLPNYLVSQIQGDFQRYLCQAFGMNKENYFHTGTSEKRGGFSFVWQKLRLVESCSDIWPSPICTQNLWSSATVTTGLLPRPFSSDCLEKSTALGHLAWGSRALLEAGWGLVYWRLGPSALSLSSNCPSAWITKTVGTKMSVFASLNKQEKQEWKQRE